MKGPLIGFLFAASSFFLLWQTLKAWPPQSWGASSVTNDEEAGAASAADENSSSPHSAPVAPPLKIIVMVGQSNMQGHGYMDLTDDDGKFLNGTLEWMVEQDPERYRKLKTRDRKDGGNATWTVRDDVWVTYNRQDIPDVRPAGNQVGPLTAGFGGDRGDRGSANPSHEIGPELGFGWTVGDALKQEPSDGSDSGTDSASGPGVLLVKVAWGGRSLVGDFRPPSSGVTTGLYYEAFLADVFRTLAGLEKIVPGYTHERGYELAGFAWHQGWNDGCDEEMVKQYESNLANLIRDVRIDLGVPDLPVTIGVSGMSGWLSNDNGNRRTRIIDAQMAVANTTRYPDFSRTVASVETLNFHRGVKPASPGSQTYHWNNICESYWLIGEAMGKAMVDLIRRKEANLKSMLRGTNGAPSSTT